MWIDLSLFKPNLISMHVHSATCSCSVELYKPLQWYTFADFYPNWNFRGVFAKLRWAGAGNRFLGSLKGLQIQVVVAMEHKIIKITNVPVPVPAIFKMREIIFFCGQITLWAISRDILRGPRLFWPLNCPECSEGQLRGSKKSWPPQNIPRNGT